MIIWLKRWLWFYEYGPIGHQDKQQSMMTSSKGNIFRVTDPLCGESTGDRWIPLKKPVTRSFYVFFALHQNEGLSNQSRRWWFETPSRLLWSLYIHTNNFHVGD